MTSAATLVRLIAFADARIAERERAMTAVTARLEQARAIERAAVDAVEQAVHATFGDCTAVELADADRHRASLAQRRRWAASVVAEATRAHESALRELVDARRDRERFAMLLAEQQRRAQDAARRQERRGEDEHAARTRRAS